MQVRDWVREVLSQPDQSLHGIVVQSSTHATVLLTVTVMVDAVVVCPAASRATAVSVCEALVAVVVFQLVLYGTTVSSLPRFVPSSLN